MVTKLVFKLGSPFSRKRRVTKKKNEKKRSREKRGGGGKKENSSKGSGERSLNCLYMVKK